ncbi:CoA transferase [Cryptosporangium aurantiacum]|uniref:CoA-transferase family III n=1 Tax=Cryptosporangium aurantiacum TaxID=134849 RepID=A0A1M7RM27_9ACTN|nr:CoA transferase [Cryptosporangium aurantiacum]SHN47138.1 CoA-transferase family III [Cryptosporangium aurantiacum]
MFAVRCCDVPGRCAVETWFAWGLADLTGAPDDPPGAPSAPVAARVEALVAALAPLDVDAAHVLAGRAALHGWKRAGRTSANGSCRLLRAADGWLAVNLSRPTDLDLLPALLEAEVSSDHWGSVAAAAASRPAEVLADRAQLLGIPAAVLGSAAGLAPLRTHRLGEPGPRLGDAGRLGSCVVLDLSAMWAGPLCVHLLGRAGAHVVKVEDVRRPDGARFGPPEFYAELHAGHASVVLDFGTPAGRAALAALAAEADVVVESSRPRALRRLGLVAEDWLAARAGRTWISITGYGRDDPAQRVAFGDDAAVAGGLVATAPDGSPVFCGDAIADPLTGLYAAAAGLASRRSGGGHLLDVAMAGVCAAVNRPADGPAYLHRRGADGTLRHVPEGAAADPDTAR